MKRSGYVSVRELADMSGLSERHVWRRLWNIGDMGRDGNPKPSPKAPIPYERDRNGHVWIRLEDVPERYEEPAPAGLRAELAALRSRLEAAERRIVALEKSAAASLGSSRGKLTVMSHEVRIPPSVPSVPSMSQSTHLREPSSRSGTPAWLLQDRPRRGDLEIGEMLAAHGATNANTARSWGKYWSMPTDSFRNALSSALERSKQPAYRFRQRFHPCAEECLSCRGLDFHYPDMA